MKVPTARSPYQLFVPEVILDILFLPSDIPFLRKRQLLPPSTLCSLAGSTLDIKFEARKFNPKHAPRSSKNLMLLLIRRRVRFAGVRRSGPLGGWEETRDRSCLWRGLTSKNKLESLVIKCRLLRKALYPLISAKTSSHDGSYPSTRSHLATDNYCYPYDFGSIFKLSDTILAPDPNTISGQEKCMKYVPAVHIVCPDIGSNTDMLAAPSDACELSDDIISNSSLHEVLYSFPRGRRHICDSTLGLLVSRSSGDHLLSLAARNLFHSESRVVVNPKASTIFAFCSQRLKKELLYFHHNCLSVHPQQVSSRTASKFRYFRTQSGTLTKCIRIPRRLSEARAFYKPPPAVVSIRLRRGPGAARALLHCVLYPLPLIAFHVTTVLGRAHTNFTTPSRT
ncbi:hypothetical protein EVAR_93425_1 [Eumeta japonica]|uniref:Uncharacterized protein n=1 Tax=Eumeta variegata TaxID=151549 RepID=A0A4C1UPW1_EUMVA|nr:hypothetical protein EVAR_93425_1 [Eumeta japonica]